uniref:Uncharacterized protein n=1 Tax=Dendroctonus ponderosae TaxID=77166 RepID=A0AAR5NZ66_DENPD
MCEVSAQNFPALFPEIKGRLGAARFVALDLEFSALNPRPEHLPSIFDSPDVRYAKLRLGLEGVVPLQVGLTAFTFDSALNSYSAHSFSFHVQPAAFQGVNRCFLLQTSSLAFLKLHNFDFNKFAYGGVPFINRRQEQGLRELMGQDQLSELSASNAQEIAEIVSREGARVAAWLKRAQPGQELALADVPPDEEVRFFVQRALRARFAPLWTCVHNGELRVQCVTADEFAALDAAQPLEEALLEGLLGFARVLRLLAELRVPLVGHNLLQDLLLVVACFEQPLPESYSAFKRVVQALFPQVFDTRLISHKVRMAQPEAQRWNDRCLQTMFEFFQQGAARGGNAPSVVLAGAQDSPAQFHNAAWDSYCTGYAFIQLAHMNISGRYPKAKQFVSSELLAGLRPFENRINLIRCSVPCMNLAGADPDSTRPPHLVIEARKNSPLNVRQRLFVGAPAGDRAAEPLRLRGGAQAAPAPHGTDRLRQPRAKRILRELRHHPQYRIGPYVAWKHSPLVRPLLLGALTVSGALLLWQLLHVASPPGAPPVPA